MELLTRPKFQISERFRRAVEARISMLERDAAHDAALIPTLSSADHRRRQRLLVETQIDQAVRLRSRLSFDGATPADSHGQSLSER